MGTIYKAIISDRENFEISIIKHSGKWVKKPALELLPFSEELRKQDQSYFWDNSNYLKKLYEALKDRDKKSGHYTEFKDFCNEHAIDFKTMKKELYALLKQAKKENFFEDKL